MTMALPDSRPSLAFAPMESLGSAIYRRLHAEHFGGVDRYYIAFVTPTREPRFTARQLKELSASANDIAHTVPQLLTRRAEDFLWAARTLLDMGYPEVNLNLGCPAGTVVAKGKGAGFLRDRLALQRFLDTIFEAEPDIALSIKTRLGWASPEEFEPLIDLFNRYRLTRLTIHARVKTDQYRGHARREAFERFAPKLAMPLGYNGDIVTAEDIRACEKRHPQLDEIMIGRALIADPALLRKYNGGAPVSCEELLAFSDALLEAHAVAWNSRKNSLMRMKEYWFYFANLFEDSGIAFKALVKSSTEYDYRKALESLCAHPMRKEPRFGWFKPLPLVD